MRIFPHARPSFPERWPTPIAPRNWHGNWPHCYTFSATNGSRSRGSSRSSTPPAASSPTTCCGVRTCTAPGCPLPSPPTRKCRGSATTRRAPSDFSTQVPLGAHRRRRSPRGCGAGPHGGIRKTVLSKETLALDVLRSRPVPAIVVGRSPSPNSEEKYDGIQGQEISREVRA